MPLVIVPNKLSELLYEKIDVLIDAIPDLKDSREDLYKAGLAYFNKTGNIPEFRVTTRRVEYKEQGVNLNKAVRLPG